MPAAPRAPAPSTTEVAAPGDDGARALHRWTLGTTMGLVLAAHHVYRAHALYLVPAGQGRVGVAAALVAVPLAWVAARRSGVAASVQVPWLLLGTAVAGAALGVVPFAAFDGGRWATVAPAACVLLSTTLVLLSSRAAWLAVGRHALMLDLARYLQSPLRLSALGAAAGLLMAASAHVGFLRSGLCLSGGLALAATWYEAPYRFLHEAPLASGRALRTAGCAAVGLVLVALVGTLRGAPLRELSHYPDEVVFAADGAVHRLVVTAAPGGYELFRDGQLAVASLDEHRRATALVRPALDAAERRARLLLLHGGTGTVERAILSASGVASLTVVVEDAALLRLARGLPWLAALAGGSLDDARVQRVVAEPIVWLAEHAGTYDVVIDDLPAPTGYREGKHYTGYYFELLAAHTEPAGLVVVPAASAFGSNEAFSTIVATLHAAGLRTATYHAAIPTLGVASFVVGSRRRLDVDLLRRTEGVSVDEGLDLDVLRDAAHATLHDQHVVAAFRDAREHR